MLKSMTAYVYRLT